MPLNPVTLVKVNFKKELNFVNTRLCLPQFCIKNCHILKYFLNKLQKAIISFVMSVRPSVLPFTCNSPTPTERISVKFRTGTFFTKMSSSNLHLVQNFYRETFNIPLKPSSHRSCKNNRKYHFHAK